MNTGIESLLLHAWLSPAFPTGGFAYSHGIEWAVEAGDLGDEPGLLDWLADLLTHGSGRNDAILLRHACRADAAELTALCAFATATAGGRERLAETLGQGDAFARAALVWGSPRLAGLAGRLPYPVAVGALAADHGVAEDAVVAAYLQALGSNLISAAVRLIPLGQTAGLRVLAALQPRILAVARETRGAALDDIGGACFRADIAAMRHETQHTRLFRT
ncbi:MAG TPA: urease accessory UreF family protein [Acetobacteraceae bacterium]